MVEQTFECSNCYEVFNKEHTTEVLWTQCPHCEAERIRTRPPHLPHAASPE